MRQAADADGRITLSPALRRAGWIVGGLVAVNPLHVASVAYGWHVVHGSTPPTLSSQAGMGFDLRSMSVHCGLLSWLGAWGALLSVVWFIPVTVTIAAQAFRGARRLHSTVSMLLGFVLLTWVTTVGSHMWLVRVYGISLVRQDTQSIRGDA